MKLDREEDRSLLLQIIESTNFQGKAVMVLADLVVRIQKAGIEPKKPELVEPEAA